VPDGAATTAAQGAAAEAATNVDEGTGEDDAARAAGEGDGRGGALERREQPIYHCDHSHLHESTARVSEES